jgi:uncharacterized protein (DUF1778 family)
MAPFCCLFDAMMITFHEQYEKSLEFASGNTKESSMATKTERITARVPENVHALLERAAGLLGATMNQFVVQAAVDRAKQVVEDENIIRLSNESTKLFFETLENPPAPGDKLLAAARAHKERLNAED